MAKQSKPKTTEPETTSDPKKITIQNVGPIERVEIPIPESGVIVLRGHNGSGKSTAIETVESLLGAPASGLSLRDGELKGTAEGFGVKIIVNKVKTHRTGELVTTGFESRLDLAAFIDPKISNPAAADAKRIKSLATLSGLTANPAIFYPLFGQSTDFDLAMDPATVAKLDVIELASAVKRRLEAMAREAEKTRDEITGKEKAARDSIVKLSRDPSGTPAELEEARTNAERYLATIQEMLRQEHMRAAKRANAREQLAKFATDRDAEKLAEAVKEARAVEVSILGEIERLDEKRFELNKQLTAQKTAAAGLESELKLAREADAKRRELLSIIEDQHTDPPTDAEIEAAKQAAENAKGDVIAAALKAENVKRLGKAEQYKAAVAKWNEEIERLRNAAKSVDGLVSEQIKAESLTIEDGRLVTITKRGKTYFNDLSHGERTKIALQLGLARVGRGGLLVLPQEFWEGLDGAAKSDIDEAAKSLGVIVLTAEASEGREPEPVHAEIYSGGELFKPDETPNVNTIKG